MILLQKLKIDSNTSLDILVPPVEDKFNTYCKPTSELHKFDEIFVVFKKNNFETPLFSDLVDIVIGDGKEILRQALKQELILSEAIDVGDLGRNYNISTYSEDDEKFDFIKFVLWSGGFTRCNLRTFIYNKDKKIYLEIAPVYPWIWDEPNTITDNNYIPFDKFMKTYKPIAVEELDPTIIQKWIEQFDEILKTMITTVS